MNLLAIRGLLLLAVLAAVGVRAQDAARPLKVCATVPDLGQIVEETGGGQVAVTVFTRGPQDPHFLEPKPSFIKELNSADLLILVGFELEVGWAPNLWRNARNARVLPGADGHLDASTVITPRDAPVGLVDRSLGDVHPAGNPHYLVDPLSGLKVAQAVRDRLIRLRPEKKGYFDSRHDDFAKRVKEALVGKRLAGKYDAEKLAQLAEYGKLDDFLAKQGAAPLEGWLGRMAALRSPQVVDDHNLWPYFAARFGLRIVDHLEPKPGVAPTTRHLASLIEIMKASGIRGILTAPYFDPRHARFVAEKTGASVIRLAHQCGALAGTESYVAMVEYNVKQIETALGGAK